MDHFGGELRARAEVHLQRWQPHLSGCSDAGGYGCEMVFHAAQHERHLPAQGTAHGTATRTHTEIASGWLSCTAQGVRPPAAGAAGRVTAGAAAGPRTRAAACPASRAVPPRPTRRTWRSTKRKDRAPRQRQRPHRAAPRRQAPGRSSDKPRRRDPGGLKEAGDYVRTRCPDLALAAHCFVQEAEQGVLVWRARAQCSHQVGCELDDRSAANQVRPRWRLFEQQPALGVGLCESREPVCAC
jgi:hypothetical protein